MAGKKCINCGSVQRKYFDYRKYTYLNCKKCGLVSTFPLPTETEIKNHYEKRAISGNYKTLGIFSEQYKNIYKDFVIILQKELKKEGVNSFKDVKVLDVGCFTGEFLHILHKKGADVYGVELQRGAAEKASKKMPNKILSVDIAKQNFPKSNFEVITLQGLVEHVVNPKELLTKSHTLLKKNGIIMIQTPNSGSLLARALKKYWPPYSPIEHIHIYSMDGLIQSLEEIGFTVTLKKNHWKRLPVSYVFEMLQNFGPEFHKALRPIYLILPQKMKMLSLPFYVGEMIIVAKKIR